MCLVTEGSPLSFQPRSVQFQEQEVKKRFDCLLFCPAALFLCAHIAVPYLLPFVFRSHQPCRYDIFGF